MAQNTDITCPADEWTLLTNDDVDAIRVQNGSSSYVRLAATSGTAAPTDAAGSLLLRSLETLAADLRLAQLWPGVVSPKRVWAMPSHVPAVLSVSHA